MSYINLNNEQVIEKYLEIKRIMRLVFIIMWSVILTVFALGWYLSGQFVIGVSFGSIVGLFLHVVYLATFACDEAQLSGLYERATGKKVY